MILPDWTGISFDNTVVIVSVLAYEAIKRGTKLNYKTIFGKIDIQTKDIVGFPCKPRLVTKAHTGVLHSSLIITSYTRGVWHWILVAVVPQKKL